MNSKKRCDESLALSFSRQEPMFLETWRNRIRRSSRGSPASLCHTNVDVPDRFFFFRFVDVVVSFQSCIGFTKKQDNQIKQTCYAQASQIRAVRKKMCDIMSEEAGKCDLRELVLKL